MPSPTFEHERDALVAELAALLVQTSEKMDAVTGALRRHNNRSASSTASFSHRWLDFVAGEGTVPTEEADRVAAVTALKALLDQNPGGRGDEYN
ncbi:hypothetical protein H696_05796 [Fonticula alba]|uniref:Uncharacterized protein n=1 Tax=Fonticula alba TaxID=691883 RepID=A0A058Z0M1_FONAL|nr:hypothetical protein H696_05796 [Fonticula alba]KCV67686.1 hypothetical protein H696_05796 [Fonticula alba]|eukprot:XP_009497870.1 hypothetical protein H696_05796 [Fonticula alba]